MELIRISDRKMKIMLTPTDMRHFELDADTFGEDSAEMHRAFRLLLEEVKKQTGFEADDTHIAVQYFPSREGGCEMFISNCSDAENDEKAKSCCPFTANSKALQIRQNNQNGFYKECAYRFYSLKALLAVCLRLAQTGYVGSSSSYRDEREHYYLLLKTRSSSPFSVPEQLRFIVEYGSIESPTALRLYLLEHGSVICEENAVHRLGNLY